MPRFRILLFDDMHVLLIISGTGCLSWNACDSFIDMFKLTESKVAYDVSVADRSSSSMVNVGWTDSIRLTSNNICFVASAALSTFTMLEFTVELIDAT